MHQLAELNRAAEKARCGDDKRKHHRGLAKKVGKPDQVFLLFYQEEVIGQNGGKSRVKVAALHCFAFVQRDGFAVFAHPDHVVPKVGLNALLLEIQPDLRPTNIVGNHAAQHAIQHRHPDHKARYAVAAAAQSEGKSTRQ